jgi:hypothetical protein
MALLGARYFALLTAPGRAGNADVHRSHELLPSLGDLAAQLVSADAEGRKRALGRCRGDDTERDRGQRGRLGQPNELACHDVRATDPVAQHGLLEQQDEPMITRADHPVAVHPRGDGLSNVVGVPRNSVIDESRAVVYSRLWSHPGTTEGQ